MSEENSELAVAREPEPTPEAEITTGTEATPEANAEGGEGETTEVEEPAKKSPVAKLQGRVGYLTKELNAKDAKLADAERRADAAEAILRRAPAAEGDTPAPETDVQKLIETRAEQIAKERETQREKDTREREFTKQCNAIAAEGEKAFPDWAESLANLNSTGILTEGLVDAALATDTPAVVLHHLGSDLDEAERISSLPPARMGAELAKLATKLSGPKKTPISNAPAPITPVNGAARAEINIYDPNLTDAEYIAARVKMKAPYAR